MKTLFYCDNSLSKGANEQKENKGMSIPPENYVFHYYQLDVEEDEEALIKEIIKKNCFNVRFFNCLNQMQSAISFDKFVKENVKIGEKDANKWVDFTLEIIEITETQRQQTHSLKGKMMSSYCIENFTKITYFNRKF